jgi:hypothetical protein
MTIPIEVIHPECGKRLGQVQDPATYLKGTQLKLDELVFCNGCASSYLVSEREIDGFGEAACPTELENIQCDYPLDELIVVTTETHLRDLRRKATPSFPF